MPQPNVDQAPPGQVPEIDNGNRSVAALRRVVAALAGGGEGRPGQVEMAEAVAAAVLEGRHLVVRAGTGTGKTLGYLVPAILSGRRVVVATATRALQDQLATKDLPFLDEHLDQPFDWAVLKGRSNYLCAQRLAELAPRLASGDADPPIGGVQMELDHIDGFAERADPSELARLSDWARETLTGDRSDLDHEPSEAAWAAVSTTARDCPGAHRCPRGDDCFAEAARARAAEADVVVVNQHLYGLDLSSDGAILPGHDVTIIDEAHQVDDIISATAGVELAAGRFTHLARTLRGILADAGDTITRVGDAGTLLTDALAGHRDRRLVTPLPTDLADTLVRLRNRVEEAVAALRSIPDDAPDDTSARAVRARQAATSLLDDIDAVAEPGDDHVLFGPERAPVLRLAPLDVAPLLQSQLWSRRPVVLTSATLAPGFGARLGLPPGSDRLLDVGSPFDYQANGLIYCAARLPRPTDPRWADAAVDELAALVDAAGGRTLALFTSYRAMERAARALRQRLPYPLLAQGDLPKPVLVDRFSGDPETCLFATMSFWQGIDVPGPSLSLVAIDRLPFPRPDDPLLQARREHVGAGAFDAIDVPRAATLLAQGAGRLIRTATDRGAVAVLDPRLATARYGPKIVATLPRMRRTKDRAEIERFLRDLRAA
jgi:ATP-dependent DNA helicase DinG